MAHHDPRASQPHPPALRVHLKRAKHLESDYQRALLQRASVEFRDHRFFRRNVGAIRLEDRFFRASLPGQCDLYVIGRGGWHGEVEIKRFTKLSPDQVAWRDWCYAWAVPWLLLEVDKAEAPPQTIARWMGVLRAWLPGTEGSDAGVRLRTVRTSRNTRT